MYDIIIAGGGPAGLTAALYALRAKKKVLIIEKSAFGGQMTSSPKIENYPGYESLSGLDLSDKMLEQVLSKGADIELAEVVEVKDGSVKTVVTDYGDISVQSVIIATVWSTAIWDLTGKRNLSAGASITAPSATAAILTAGRLSL